MARHRRQQPARANYPQRPAGRPLPYHPGYSYGPLHAASQPAPQGHRTPLHTARARVLQRVALPAASIVAVGAVTVGAAFAVGGVTGTSAQPAPRPTADVSDVATFAPMAPAGSATSLPPSARDAAEIAAAVRSSPLTAEVPPGDYEVAGTKLAVSDPSWAWTELRPKVADLDRVSGVLHETGGRWELVQLGSWEVGCDVAPPQVRDDLGLVCPAWSGPTLDA